MTTKKKSKQANNREPEVVAAFTAFGVTEKVTIHKEPDGWHVRYVRGDGYDQATGGPFEKLQRLVAELHKGPKTSLQNVRLYNQITDLLRVFVRPEDKKSSAGRCAQSGFNPGGFASTPETFQKRKAALQLHTPPLYQTGSAFARTCRMG